MQLFSTLKSTKFLLRDNYKIFFILKDFEIEPLGVMYLIAALKNAGFDVKFLKIGIDNIENEILFFNGDCILLYSILTGSHKFFANLNLQLKFKKCNGRILSIMGGPHCTFFPEFIQTDGVDVIFRGEADEALPQFLKSLLQGIVLTNLAGATVKIKDKIYNNGLCSLPSTLYLNTVFPDRDLIYSYPKHRLNKIKNIIIGRGCLYNCSYCYLSGYRELYDQQIVRHRSVDSVISEIYQLKRQYPLEFIFFQDDTFLFNSAWYREFLHKYAKEIHIPFHCQVRVEQITEEAIAALKIANCTGITFAIETADEIYRREILKRNMSNAQIERAVKIIYLYGLKLRIENMIGLPGETKEQMIKTLKFNTKLHPTVGWASIYQPYPSTKLGSYAVALGLWNQQNIDNFTETFFEVTLLDLSKCMKRFINNLQKFFSLVVKYPRLLLFIKILLKFPENRFFSLFSLWFKRYLYNKKLYK